MFKHILKRLNNIILLFLILCIGIYIFINKLLMKEYLSLNCIDTSPANGIKTRCIPENLPTCNVEDLISTDTKSRTCNRYDGGNCTSYIVKNSSGNPKKTFNYEEEATVSCGKGVSSVPTVTAQAFICNNTRVIEGAYTNGAYMNGGWNSTKLDFVCVD